MSTCTTEKSVVTRSASLYEIVSAKIPQYDKIDIHPLWGDRYRINVWGEVTLDSKGRGKGFYEVANTVDLIKERRIVSTFFVHYSNGVITKCDPEMK